MSLNIVTEIDNRIKIRNVLMSVSDKTGLETFVGEGLHEIVQILIHRTMPFLLGHYTLFLAENQRCEAPTARPHSGMAFGLSVRHGYPLRMSNFHSIGAPSFPKNPTGKMRQR